MQKITTPEFEKELQQLDPRIVIVPNEKRPGASNVFFNGIDICPWVPSFEVQDEPTDDYVYNLDDRRIPLKTSIQIKEIVEKTLNSMKKDPEYAAIMFDTPLKVEEETYGEHKA